MRKRRPVCVNSAGGCCRKGSSRVVRRGSAGAAEATAAIVRRVAGQAGVARASGASERGCADADVIGDVTTPPFAPYPSIPPSSISLPLSVATLITSRRQAA